MDLEDLRPPAPESVGGKEGTFPQLVPPTVVCVLRSGGEYKPEHVYSLMRAIEEYWLEETPRTLRRVLLTDLVGIQMFGVETIFLRHSWPGWWSKMELWRPDLAYLGDILYFDLDTIIVGDLEEIAAVRRLTLLADFYRGADRLGSGMMYLPVEERADVWAAWMRGGPEAHMRKFRGDQEFLTATLLSMWEVARWQQIVPEQVLSYKVHVRPTGRVPNGARVLCFHGRPRPWQLKDGRLPGCDVSV